MRLPPVQPRSRLAHEAAKWAHVQGRFDDFNAALFRAIFERGEDIGDTAVLTRLATGLGLDGGALYDSLALGKFTREVLADEQAAEHLGVSGVPAFVADRRAALTGVQTAGALRELVRRVRAARGAEASGGPLPNLPVNIARRGGAED